MILLHVFYLHFLPFSILPVGNTHFQLIPFFGRTYLENLKRTSNSANDLTKLKVEFVHPVGALIQTSDKLIR